MAAPFFYLLEAPLLGSRPRETRVCREIERSPRCTSPTVPQMEFDRLVESDNPPMIEQLARSARAGDPEPDPLVRIELDEVERCRCRSAGVAIAVDLQSGGAQPGHPVPVDRGLPREEFLEREAMALARFLDAQRAAAHGVDDDSLAPGYPAFGGGWRPVR